MIHVVGLADMKFSSHPDDVLVTYALGSCLGITVYDPVARVGGLLHAMMPVSTIDPERAIKHPARYVDTGVTRLFTECYKRGALKERMILTAAGGASSHDDEDDDWFQIGRRIILVLRKLLHKNGVRMSQCELGGGDSRTVTLYMNDGCVSIISHEKQYHRRELLRRRPRAKPDLSNTRTEARMSPGEPD